MDVEGNRVFGLMPSKIVIQNVIDQDPIPSSLNRVKALRYRS